MGTDEGKQTDKPTQEQMRTDRQPNMGTDEGNKTEKSTQEQMRTDQLTNQHRIRSEVDALLELLYWEQLVFLANSVCQLTSIP
ncbi:hypothetical protein RRG08_061338 [Elysia crispata]|uniref:Uncharacterized protein n=1 Tax=Elysia crispata TaxID=231223 RepID=A0AAE1AFR6_9GAST|nr:hypothetical protein RRG08_061338 [Elysia crispata]